MSKIKLCGLTRPCDIEAVNVLIPEYVGFVFAKNSKRYTTCSQAAVLKKMLHPDIMAVGVFVDEDMAIIRDLLDKGVIDMLQLHGGEDETYIEQLRKIADIPIIKAFRIDDESDIAKAEKSTADYVLLDSTGGGTGRSFDWNLLSGMSRPYFLAGGLDAGNVREAVCRWHPYAVDVSSGIETDGCKDVDKMRAFVEIVRNNMKGRGL